MLSFLTANWMLVLVMLLSGGMLAWPFIQRLTSPMKEIGNLNATHLINARNAILLDVREPKQYESGRMPNAIQIPLQQLSERGQELGKLTSRPVVVYSERGQGSRGALGLLTKLGFKEVYALSGGFKAWKDAGLPVEK